MTDALNVHHQLYRGGKILVDPGDAGIINVTQDLQICEMVSATAETRTLANPTKAGIRFVLRLLTDGGTVTVTAPAGLNSSLETEATFADESDILSLISVSLTATTFRWEILEGNVGTIISSASVSSTPSASVSNTPSSTPSSSVSNTPSSSVSNTPSSSPSETS